MDVTPQELRGSEIKDAWRGYDRDEVDDLLERAAVTIENLTRQDQSPRHRSRSRSPREPVDGAAAVEPRRRRDAAAHAAARAARRRRRGRRGAGPGPPDAREAEAKAQALVSDAEATARRIAEGERRRLEARCSSCRARRELLLRPTPTRSTSTSPTTADAPRAASSRGRPRALDRASSTSRVPPSRTRPERATTVEAVPDRRGAISRARPPSAHRSRRAAGRTVHGRRTPGCVPRPRRWRHRRGRGSSRTSAVPPGPNPPVRRLVRRAAVAARRLRRRARPSAESRLSPRPPVPRRRLARRRRRPRPRARPARRGSTGTAQPRAVPGRPRRRAKPPRSTPTLDDDAFFASLREAVRDDTPLGPRRPKPAALLRRRPRRRPLGRSAAGGSRGSADRASARELERDGFAVDRRARARRPAPTVHVEARTASTSRRDPVRDGDAARPRPRPAANSCTRDAVGDLEAPLALRWSLSSRTRSRAVPSARSSSSSGGVERDRVAGLLGERELLVRLGAHLDVVGLERHDRCRRRAEVEHAVARRARG